jgi:heat shock protein HslJ
MKNNFIYFILISIVMGCTSNTKKETFWINSYKTECVGVAPMSCLLIKRTEDGSWENFYEKISGFEYVPGYIYKIEVEVEETEKVNTPADKSIYSYKLKEVMSKEVDRKLRINDIWVASKIGEIQIQQLEMQPRIEISVKDMSLQGTDGCNSIRASLKTLTETDVTFGAAMGTRKLCPNMEIPNAFNVALQSVNSYEIKENKLYLFDNNGKELIQFFKID